MKGTELNTMNFEWTNGDTASYSEIRNERQDTSVVSKDSIPPRPTFQQIRYWRWLQEKKLLVDGERLMKPKQEVELISSINVETNNQLGLSIHEKNTTTSDWLTILFLIATIIFATIRMTSTKYVVSLFQSLINYSTSFRMYREKNYTILHGAYRLDILFYFVFSLFLYQVIGYLQLELVDPKLTFYVANFGFVILYFVGKKALYQVLGKVFESTFETNEYLFNMDNFNRTVGLVLFPIVALINYYPSYNPVFMLFSGISIVLIFYVFQIQRGISILLRKQFSIFYLFLYLCTLEFLPLLLIYKVVVL